MAKALPIPGVSADTPLGEFAARVIEVRSGEVRTRLGDVEGDPAAVHDRRVALRRLRTAIELFDPALPKRAVAVRRELKVGFAVLGPRRDADVAVEIMLALEPGLDAEDRPGFDGLLAEFRARAAVSGAGLGSGPGVERAVERAERLAARARARGGPRAEEALRAAARRRLRSVLRDLPALRVPRDGEALHDLRLSAKRLRYALEAGAPALGESVAPGAAAARELQTLLGDIHDCDVLLPAVRAHRRGLREADVAALGRGEPAAGAPRYRGVQAVDTRLRARRERLRGRLAERREAIASTLTELGGVLAR